MVSERLGPQTGVQLLPRSVKQPVWHQSSRVKDRVVWDKGCLWGDSGQMTNDGRDSLMPGRVRLGPWPNLSSMERAQESQYHLKVKSSLSSAGGGP